METNIQAKYEGRRGDDWRERARVRGNTLSDAWRKWLAPVSWQFFATLTFDWRKVFPVGETLASKEAFWWCTQLARILRRPLGWLYAVERGRTGLWHAHALIIGVPGQLGNAPTAMWKERNGQIDVRPVYAAGGVTLYSTKQAARSGEIVFSDTLERYLPSVPVHARAVDLYPNQDDAAHR